jgi:hypothetical protein
VATELTVWCENGSFAWTEDGSVVTHPAEDPAGAARLILRQYRNAEQSIHTTGQRAGEGGWSPPTPRA